MKKNALISVFYKQGLEEVAEILLQAGWTLFCSDGTARFLKEKGFAVHNVADLTGFGNLLSGRVKTLHTAVFAGILAKDSEEHSAELKKSGFDEFSLIMVNFYPFEQALLKKDQGLDFMVENIDVGGPAMVRAAAKNFQHRVVVVDAADYLPVVRKLAETGEIEFAERKRLAQKAFSYTAFYDSLIAGYLNEEVLPEFFVLAGSKVMNLRYGENPQQQAALYVTNRHSPFAAALQLQGKALSYNNLLDAFSVYQICNEFENEKAFSVIVKHQNPCGAAQAKSPEEAFRKALDSDAQSAFGGIVGFNCEVDAATAGALTEGFFEVVVAADYSAEALQILQKKKNLRLLKLPAGMKAEAELRLLTEAFLLQQADREILIEADLQLKSGEKLNAGQIADVLFGWKIIKYVKSNAIILVKNGQVVGVGAGQMSRIDSVKIALEKAGLRREGAILISDGFFPFPDSLLLGMEKGVSIFVEPGGSLRDREVIDFARQHELTLYFTGKRAFRH